MKIQTITINGNTFEISDPGVNVLEQTAERLQREIDGNTEHVTQLQLDMSTVKTNVNQLIPQVADSVLTTPQTLPETRQEQARLNIGAVGYGDIENPLIIELTRDEDDNLVMLETEWTDIVNAANEKRPVELVHMFGDEDFSDTFRVRMNQIYVEAGYAYFSYIDGNRVDEYFIHRDNSVETRWTSLVSHNQFDNAELERKINRVTAIDETADDEHYPTAKAVYDYVGNAEHTVYRKLYDRVEITEEDIAAAGDEGITCITIGSDDLDLTPYNDILIKFHIPKSDTINTADAGLQISATNTANESLAPDHNTLMRQGTTSITPATALTRQYKMHKTARTVWDSDGYLLYGQLSSSNFGSIGYPTTVAGWPYISENFNKNEKHYFHMLNVDLAFKFPAGTWVELYGR